MIVADGKTLERYLENEKIAARVEVLDRIIHRPPVHLVLKSEWPVALCGYIVASHLGVSAPGRDRCVACLEIARDRGLRRPGWAVP